MLSHEIVILWLDTHIGVPGSYVHLKEAFSTTIDPTYPYPISLYDRDSITLNLNKTDSKRQNRFQGPCELQFFTDEKQCLKSINKCFDTNKQIFLILPDYVRKDFFLRIYNQHPKEFQKTENEISIKFYIFIFMLEIEEWFFDYEDYLRIYYHEAELLYALTRDIAMYYMMIGKKLCNENTLNNIQQALIYFQWAYTLILRGNSISPYKEIELQNSLKAMIYGSKKTIHSMEKENYLQYDSINNLNENIFIYSLTELNDQALKLATIVNQIINKNPLLFNNLEDFFLSVQLERYKNQHNCPIIIVSNIDHQTNIFEELSSIRSIEHIYVLDLSEHKLIEQNTYRTLLKKFSKIQNIYANMNSLVRGWILEHSTRCEKIGDYFKENGDMNQARLTNSASNMEYISLLILLGPPNILEDFHQRDFLHRKFFIHYFSRDKCTTELQKYQNVLEMDIFLPHSSIDLISTYRNFLCPRISFYVYCQTEQILTEYQQMPIWSRYDLVFNMNMLREELERRAQKHLLIYIEDLEKRKQAGDADAADLLVPIGEIFEENARRINEEIRQKSCLSEIATEYEEG
ncbi:unnamed protein product [Rotaria sordida]|uniref:Uncharacterized protein n=1 Tax=Rotaria sordida TaxID=392033 RepID=A0A819PP21_9BILA|nr:unnamed protein product [Rotaria sordida]